MNVSGVKKDVIDVESAGWRDYLELCKPRVVALMLLTVIIGMCLASQELVPAAVLFWGNLGIALCAASAAVINHVVDRRIDTVMARTMNRPVAQGKVDPANALFFALVLGTLGLAVLFVQVNGLTAWLTLASLLGYAVVYTLFLKRATPQNIVIGGIAGAAPPLLGWTAVTGDFHSHALLLVLIIFAWTPPHFWALAIHRKEEYAKANVPMLPVTHGEAYTKLHIVLYSVVLLLAALLPWLTGMSGVIYLVASTLLGARFLYWAVALYRDTQPDAAIKMFRYSITYLMLLFVVLLVDHYLYLG